MPRLPMHVSLIITSNAIPFLDADRVPGMHIGFIATWNFLHLCLTTFLAPEILLRISSVAYFPEAFRIWSDLVVFSTIGEKT